MLIETGHTREYRKERRKQRQKTAYSSVYGYDRRLKEKLQPQSLRQYVFSDVRLKYGRVASREVDVLESEAIRTEPPSLD